MGFVDSGHGGGGGGGSTVSSSSSSSSECVVGAAVGVHIDLRQAGGTLTVHAAGRRLAAATATAGWQGVGGREGGNEGERETVPSDVTLATLTQPLFHDDV